MGAVANGNQKAVTVTLEAALATRPRSRAVSVARSIKKVRSALPGLEMSDEDLQRRIETTLIERGYNIFFDR